MDHGSIVLYHRSKMHPIRTLILTPQRCVWGLKFSGVQVIITQVAFTVSGDRLITETPLSWAGFPGLIPGRARRRDMDKQEKAHGLKTGSTEWLKETLNERWQVLRRDPEYVKFCNEYASAFDENGIMKVWEGLEPRPEEIRKLFGLETICHPSLNLSKEELLDYPIFNKPSAVSYEWAEEGPGLHSPIVDDHFIKLRIDIG